MTTPITRWSLFVTIPKPLRKSFDPVAEGHLEEPLERLKSITQPKTRNFRIRHTSRYVELWRYENLSPAYLALNPNGVVPTLVHDGVPIINSFCINEYIDDVFPDPPLRPRAPADRARMRYWAWTADEIHLSLARLTHSRMLHAQVRDLDPADQAFMLEHTPVVLVAGRVPGVEEPGPVRQPRNRCGARLRDRHRQQRAVVDPQHLQRGALVAALAHAVRHERPVR